MLPGAMLKFDLRNDFPAVTTKKLAYRAVVGELIGFLRGVNTAKGFRELGCKVWDANATAPAWTDSEYCKLYLKKFNANFDDGFLGRIYGKQWRDWKTVFGSLDQIATLIQQIKTNPTSRRLLVTAWRPDELEYMALPPCHYGFQVIIEQETKTMHLLWNQRSCDVFLGIPFNIASYATLLHILARITGYTAGTLTGFLADVHFYENHLDAVREQLAREPMSLCQLAIAERIIDGTDIDVIEPDDIQLVDYVSHPAIKADMAV
jgi:thymidylate synthase